MRKTLSALALVAAAFSAAFGVSSASAFDPVSSPSEALLGTPAPFSKSWGYCRDWNNNGGQHAWSFSYSGTVFASTGCPMYFDPQTPYFLVYPKDVWAGTLSGSKIVEWYLRAYPYDESFHTLWLHDFGGYPKTLSIPRFSFVAGNLVVVPNGSNLDYKQVVQDSEGNLSLETLQSLPKPTVSASTDGMFDAISNAWDSFWNPESVAFQDPATTPVYLEFRGGSHGWTYKGADGNTYWLRVNADKYFRSAVPEVPVLSVVLDGNETLLASDTGSLGVAWYRNVSGNNLSKINVRNYGSGSHLSYVTLVSDPYVYFADQSANVFRWDVRCKTPGYDSCRLDVANSAYFCADELGNPSPGAEVCGLSDPVGLNGSAPVGDPPSSGSGSSGSGSTGSGSSPSYSTSYSWSVQDCSPKVFSGSLVSYSGSSDPTTCSFRMVGTSYACQSSDGQACVQSGDACLQALVDPDWTPVYSSDVTRYECSVSDVQCRWYSKNSCGPTSLCYQDGDYCRVKPESVPVVVTSTDPSGTSVSECSGLKCVSDAIDRFSDRLFNQQAPGIVGSTAPSSLSGSAVFVPGAWSSSVVESDAPDWLLSRSCEMFDDAGFVYHGSWAFRVSLTNHVPDSLPLATFVTRPIDWVLSPLNNVMSVFQTFWIPPDGGEICLFGSVYQVNYQGVFRGKSPFASASGTLVTSGWIPGHDPSEYVGNMTKLDYFFLFISGVCYCVSLFFVLRKNWQYE